MQHVLFKTLAGYSLMFNSFILYGNESKSWKKSETNPLDMTLKCEV